MITETAYIGRDNTIDIQLLEDGVAVDLSGVTRMTLAFEGAVIADSNEDPGVFDWDNGNGVVILKLGGLVGLTAGIYHTRLVVYDPINTNGIAWEDFICRVSN